MDEYEKRMCYYNKITELGIKCANDDGKMYDTWTIYVCAILNKIYGEECFVEGEINSFPFLPIKYNNEFIKKLNIDIDIDVIQTLYEFLDSKIRCYKLNVLVEL